MATHPTRAQQRAADLLAEALLLVTEAARLDGRSRLDLAALAPRLAAASSAFSLDEIVSRALETRTRHLGLPSDAAEILGLLECETRPLEMLLLPDDDLRALAERLRDELGDL